MGICAKSVDELVSAVDGLVSDGAGHIKLCATGGMMTEGTDPFSAQFSVEQMLAVRERADHHGMTVSAHAHGTEGIRNCVKAGIHSIEHCSFLGPEGLDFDEAVLDELVEKDLFIGATISQFCYDPSFRQPGTLKYMELMSGILRLAYCKGAKVCLHTDSWGYRNSFGGYGSMLKCAVEDFHIPVEQVLRSATIVPADLLSISHPVFKEGERATFVILDGDPFDDASSFEKVVVFYAEGKRLV